VQTHARCYIYAKQFIGVAVGIVWDLSSADEKTTPMYVADLANGKRKKLVVVQVLGLGGLRMEQAIQDSTFSEFRNTLRGLLNQWIASGRPNRELNGDEPLKRNVRWSSIQYPTPLRDTLKRFSDDGLLTIMPDADTGAPTWRMALRHGPKKLRAPALIAKEFAIAWFYRLLGSVSPQRLSLCDECGKYFVHIRTPKKDIPIKGEICCPNCKGKGGAKRSIRSREALRDDMAKAAVDALNEWRPSHRNPDRRLWVVNQLNKQFGHRRNAHITRRWLSEKRTLKAIQAEIGRRNNA
jgi:hypothetical protein